MSKSKETFEKLITEVFIQQMEDEYDVWFDHDDRQGVFGTFLKAIDFASDEYEPVYEFEDAVKSGKLPRNTVEQTLELINSIDLKAVYDEHLSGHMFQKFRSYVLDAAGQMKDTLEEVQGE